MTTHALMGLADCICGAVVDQDECPYPGGRPSVVCEERQLFVVNCTNENCGWQAIGWGEDGARKAWNTRGPATQLRTAAAEGPRTPDGYAYRYPPECKGGTAFIRHNDGREVNGARPIESIPYYYGTPPTDSGAGRDGERYRFWRKHYSSKFVICLPGATARFDAKRPQVEAFGDDYEQKIDAAIDTAIAGAAGEGR